MTGLPRAFINSADSKPEFDPEFEALTETVEEKEHEIMLYNDDVNTFAHVIETLVRVCEHSHQQAEQCAVLVHFSGKCVVKTGPYSDLEPRCTLLLEAGLSAEIL